MAMMRSRDEVLDRILCPTGGWQAALRPRRKSVNLVNPPGQRPQQGRVALDSTRASRFPMRHPRAVAYLKRFTELALAVLLACICALTIWACWEILGRPPKKDSPRWIALQIVFVLGFISSAGVS